MNLNQIVRSNKQAPTENRICLDRAIRSSLASNTRLAYDKGWNCFGDYCRQNRLCQLPAKPETVARFIINLAGRTSTVSGKTLSMGSINIYTCAINSYHHQHNLTSPTGHPLVKNTLKGLSRLKDNRPRQVKALREQQLIKMIARCPARPIGVRDRTVLSVGFGAALRRSEICQLRVTDVDFLKNSTAGPRMLLNIRRSKTDQAGAGYQIAVVDGQRIKPVSQLKNYLTLTGIESGYLFRAMKKNGRVKPTPLHHSDIPRLVKYYSAAIGLDPKDYAGHSLRAGFITSAVANRARLDKIMAISRHKNTNTIMTYIRDNDAFQDHAGACFL